MSLGYLVQYNSFQLRGRTREIRKRIGSSAPVRHYRIVREHWAPSGSLLVWVDGFADTETGLVAFHGRLQFHKVGWYCPFFKALSGKDKNEMLTEGWWCLRKATENFLPHVKSRDRLWGLWGHPLTPPGHASWVCVSWVAIGRCLGDTSSLLIWSSLHGPQITCPSVGSGAEFPSSGLHA